MTRRNASLTLHHDLHADPPPTNNPDSGEALLFILAPTLILSLAPTPALTPNANPTPETETLALAPILRHRM